jgi:hypothetical protein
MAPSRDERLRVAGTKGWLTQSGARAPNCTELPPIPKERIAINALRAEIGVPGRLRSGDLLHERQAC